ncbi:conserved hypothetical protein [Beggiatoa sp. PS]|nr:conserved hypothetical protein [Beggiatoa sp. PS]
MKSISQKNCIVFRQPGKALTLAEKWMVLRVFQRCDDEQNHFQLPKTRDVYQRASEYTGVSKKVVVEIVKYFKQTGTVPPVVKPGNRTNHPSFFPATTAERIREFINDYHRQGLTCTSKHIQEMLDSEFQITVHQRSIQRHLHDLGFKYTRVKNKTRSIREMPSIRQQRHTYLYEIGKLCCEGYTIVYLDESFIHHYQADTIAHGSKLLIFLKNLLAKDEDGVSFMLFQQTDFCQMLF